MAQDGETKEAPEGRTPDGRTPDGGSPDRPSDFIRDIITEDLKSGKHETVKSRFPPEPNGYLHIGHAKSICLNFGVAAEFGGTCNLRFDDTNPETEDMEYVEAIQRDVRWLGFDWEDRLYFASDYFEELYQFAVHLVEHGKAYVDSLSEEEIREHRGTITEPGRPGPYRNRSIMENLDLFRRMRAGEFADGEHVLRAKIDMAAKNMLMRDPILYRIRRGSEHYRRGSEWPIYPMYDFTHCLSDAIEHITHSLCTLEFENNRELYDWVIDNTPVPSRPRQIEFARLNLSHTVMSKRMFLALVDEGHVAGWDDPRMPTLSGLRRRGYTPEAIRRFADGVGVAKTYNVIDVARLEHAVRDDLNHKAPRVLAVLRPLKVVIENYPEGESERLEAPYFPHDVPKEGSRKLPFAREILIERDDFVEEPPEGYFRLAPGREVRLRYAYLIRCTGVVKDDAGEVVEVRCTYDPETRGGSAPDGRQVDGTLHWVSAEHSLPLEVRLYDRLFLDENPAGHEEDFRTFLNPDSLEVLAGSRIEPSVRDASTGDSFQFERQGYFVVDPDSAGGRLVMNRTVTLRDTWAKVSGHGQAAERREAAAARAARKAAVKAAQRRASRAAGGGERPLTAAQQVSFKRYRDELGVGAQEARVLASERPLRELFEGTLKFHAGAPTVAKWIVNELSGELRGRPVGRLPFGPEELGELAALIDRGAITGAIAKEVFAEMRTAGGRPQEIVEQRGLKPLDDRDLLPVVDRVLASNPRQVEEYHGGKTALLGFFVGQVMRATDGRADPKQAHKLLRQRLAGD